MRSEILFPQVFNFSTPGRTKQLNFFDLGRRLVLVDMPGYGYAQAAKEVKADWQGLMFEYLRGRPNLRRVLLLLDARIEIKPSDIAVMELLDRAAVTFQLVLTKADEVKPNATVTGRRYPAQRMVLTPAAAVELINRMQQVGAALVQSGVLKATPNSPPTDVPKS